MEFDVLADVCVVDGEIVWLEPKGDVELRLFESETSLPVDHVRVGRLQEGSVRHRGHHIVTLDTVREYN